MPKTDRERIDLLLDEVARLQREVRILRGRLGLDEDVAA